MADGDSVFKFTHAEKVVNHNNGAFGGVYFLAFVGALIYFFQQPGTFWDFIIRFFQALFWPALVMYEVLKILDL